LIEKDIVRRGRERELRDIENDQIAIIVSVWEFCKSTLLKFSRAILF